jgi:predicted ATPase
MERHQTLRGTVDWSYELLEESEARVFARLAVFTGGFTLEAAEAVVSSDGIVVDDVFDVLSGLVARSMVVCDEPDGQSRYRLLETMRQYARERLDATGEGASVRRRHAEYFASLGEITAEGLKGRDEERWGAVMDRELANFEAALEWSVGAHDAELALRLTISLVASERIALIRIVQPAFDMPEALAHPLRPAAMARASIPRFTLSADYSLLGDWVDATDAAFEAAGLAPTAEARFAHAVLASLTRQAGPVRAYGDTAIEMALDAGDRHLASFQCALLAMFLTVARDHDTAIDRAEQAQALASELGNPSLNAVVETALGFALSPIDPDAAIAHLRTALLASGTASSEMVYDTGGRCLARLLAGRGEFIAALETYADCLERVMESGALFSITLACDSLAVDLVSAGHNELAATLFGALEVPLADYQGNPLIPRDAAIDSLQRAMGTQRFDDRAARGRAMEIEDLGVYTLAEIARILEETGDR